MPDYTSRNSWRKYRFDEMAVIINDRIDDPSEADVEYYVGLEHLDSESLTIRRWGSPSDVEATKLRFRAGDIIFGRRRVYQRKLAVAHFDGICSAHAMVLRAKPEVALLEFLPFFMQSDLFMERAKEISVGSLSPTINWKTLAEEEFALPPLEEQRRIADALADVSTYKEKLIEARIKAEQAEEALFLSLLARRPLSSKNRSKSNSIDEIGSRWPRLKMSAVADVAYGISAAVADNRDPAIGWPILTGANIALEGQLDLRKLVYHAPPSKDAFLLRKGDVLLNWRSGSQAHVGKTAIFELEGEWTFASFILRVRAGDALYNMFLWRLLNYMRKHQLFGAATSQQINFKMNAAYFRDVSIPCPTRPDQERIVGQLQPLWAAREALVRRHTEVQGLSVQLLTGDARAPR